MAILRADQPEIKTCFNIRTHNGCVTITNPATGQHRTFQIRTQPADARFAPGERIVSMLAGPDNQHAYRGFGFIKPDGSVVLWKRCRTDFFERVVPLLQNPARFQSLGIEYDIEGHCRRCNRLLTVPESIRSGIGPTCAEHEHSQPKTR